MTSKTGRATQSDDQLDRSHLIAFLLSELGYDSLMNALQRKLFKTRLLLIAVALIGVALAFGLHRLIR